MRLRLDTIDGTQQLLTASPMTTTCQVEDAMGSIMRDLQREKSSLGGLTKNPNFCKEFSWPKARKPMGLLETHHSST